jgi:uncharacterized protein YlaI
METPVCDMCRLTPVKCKICEKKQVAGELTEADFDVSRAMSISKSDLKLKRSFDLGKCYAGVFKGEVDESLREALGRDLIKVSSGEDLLNKLGLKARPSRVFVGGEEKQRVALTKSQLENMGISSSELKKALNYFKFDASIV